MDVITLKEIVEKYLKDNNFDGLYSGDGCECEIGSLFPCGNIDRIYKGISFNLQQCKARVYMYGPTPKVGGKLKQE